MTGKKAISTPVLANMMSAELTFIDWVTAISGIATAAAVGFVAYQSYQTKQQLRLTQQEVDMTKQQMDSTLRAWIGIVFGGFKLENERLNIRLKNYGQLPALFMQIRAGITLETVTKEEITNVERPEMLEIMNVPPDSERDLWLSIPEYKRVIREQLPVYIVIMAFYKYANDKNGRYQIIHRINFAKREEAIVFEEMQ